MDELEKYIVENKEEFDVFEPNEGHFERFQQKLKKQEKKTIVFKPMFFAKAASVAVLITLSSLWFYQNVIQEKQEQYYGDLQLQNTSSEYNEIEVYYTSQVKSKYNEINSLDKNNEESKMMLKEISEMDSLYKNMQEDLKKNPNDERVVNAIIQHYKIKIQVLNKIINRLNNVKSKKSSRYEKTEI